MKFKDYLAQMPDIAHLRGLDVCDENGTVLHHIPAAEGKLGSLKLYHALAVQFDGVLNAESAAQGIVWFAEHAADARENVGKHPNVDWLFKVQNAQLSLRLIPLLQAA